MTKTQVLELLKANRDERGEAHWRKLGETGLKSYGIGLTRLRKLAKEIGRSHELSQKLWSSEVYDARVIAALIDEPKKMSRDQAEAQLEDLTLGMLAHVYCSCDAALAKTPFARELAVDWIESKDSLRRRCGYLLLYELARNRKDKALDDAFFTRYVTRIAETIHAEDNGVKDGMNTSLLAIGKRNLKLNKAVIKAARSMGKVAIDYGDTGCEPVDILKHMTNARLQEKLRA